MHLNLTSVSQLIIWIRSSKDAKIKYMPVSGAVARKRQHAEQWNNILIFMEASKLKSIQGTQRFWPISL